MKKNKTQPTSKSVKDFFAEIPDQQKRQDAEDISKMMEEITGEKPKMWGSSIVGFGSYHYVYESGREGDAPASGFSPRRHTLVVYLMDAGDNTKLLEKLGPHSTSKACLYFKRLADIDTNVLKTLIANSHKKVKATYS